MFALMNNLAKQGLFFLNKKKVLLFIFFIFFTKVATSQNQLIPNNCFSIRSEEYRDRHSSGINNVTSWKAINTVDYYQKALDTNDIVGLTTDMVFEYIYCNLDTETQPMHSYNFSITLFGNIKDYALSFLLFDTSQVNYIDEFTIKQLNSSLSSSYELFDLSNSKRTKHKKAHWNTYMISIVPTKKHNMFLLGNCTQVSSKKKYVYVKSVSLFDTNSKSRTLR